MTALMPPANVETRRYSSVTVKLPPVSVVFSGYSVRSGSVHETAGAGQTSGFSTPSSCPFEDPWPCRGAVPGDLDHVWCHGCDKWVVVVARKESCDTVSKAA